MTTYALSSAAADKTKADIVVIGVTTTKGGGVRVAGGGEAVAKAYGRKLAPMLSSLGFTAKAEQLLKVPTNGVVKASQVLFVGLGDRNGVDTDRLRRAAGLAARNLGNAASAAVALPATDLAQLRAVIDGAIAGGYRYPGHRSATEKGTQAAEVVVLTALARRSEAVDLLETARVVGELTAVARDWVNEPPNLLNPETLATAAADLAKSRSGRRKPKVSVEVFDKARLEELDCGGILGVGAGSTHEPRLVKLTWKPPKARGQVALVGKGITFDSGGLTIKPGTSMNTMKLDMAGAATVIAAVHAIAELDLPVAVTAWAPLAENMPSGTAMRPGDVLVSHSGKTIEVTNTDAEGRLILADALALAAEEEPDAIVEISTLTGACVIALGNRMAGIFGDDSTVATVRQAATDAGELMWPLPLPEHIVENVRSKSTIADVLQTDWVRWGGASYAAAFLMQFVGDRPWAHIDIAGPAYNEGGAWGHVPAGATGIGVATLVQLVKDWQRD